MYHQQAPSVRRLDRQGRDQPRLAGARQVAAAMNPTVFLLSPASCGGKRTDVLLNGRADFELAVRLRSQGASLGEVFSFLSGLYFRGKLAYARAFAAAPAGVAGVQVITTYRGLLSPDEEIRISDIRAFGSVGIAATDPRFAVPLREDAQRLRARLPAGSRIVLLGSVATDKYTSVLLDVLGDDLLFPGEFVGRGDMSRGGLLLRCVDAGTELAYIPVRGAVRRGSRPPRLEPRR